MKKSSIRRNRRNFSTKLDGVNTKITAERKGKKIIFTGDLDNGKKMKFYLDTKSNTACLLNGTRIGKLEQSTRKRRSSKIKSKKTVKGLSVEIPFNSTGLQSAIKKIQKESKSIVKIQLDHEIEKMKIKLDHKLGKQKASNELKQVKIEKILTTFHYAAIFTCFVSTMLTFWYTGMFDDLGGFIRGFIGTKIAEKGIDAAAGVGNKWADAAYQFGFYYIFITSIFGFISSIYG